MKIVDEWHLNLLLKALAKNTHERGSLQQNAL
jgi:hypothetical protein